MRRGMTLIEVMVATAILCGLMCVLVFGTFQMCGSSMVDSQRLMDAKRMQRAEIAGLRSGERLATVDHATVRGEVEVGPALSGLSPTTSLDAALTASVLYAGEGHGVAVLPDAVWRGWISGTSAEGVLVPDDLGLVRVPLGLPVELHWRQVAHGSLPVVVDLDWSPVQASLSFSDGTPLEGVARAGTFEWPSTERVEVAFGTTRVGLARDLGLLGAAGMLLFGVGFLYVHEGERPGELDDVRLGGAMLLALDYALFFAVQVTLLLGTALPSLVVGAVALGLALPLLSVHLRHLTDAPFAMGRAVPWALVSWGLVLAWVSVPQGRLLLTFGVGVAVLAFVTLTWERFSARRALHAEASWQAHVQRDLQCRMTTAIEQTRAVLAVQRARLDLAQRALEAAPAGLQAARGQVVRGRLQLTDACSRASELLRTVDAPCTEDVLTWEHAHTGVRGMVERAATALEAAVAHLHDTAERSHAELSSALYRCEREAEFLRLSRQDSDALQAFASLQQRVEAGVEDPSQLSHDARVLELSFTDRGEFCGRCGHLHTTDGAHCPGCGSHRLQRLGCTCGASQLALDGVRCCTDCGRRLVPEPEKSGVVLVDSELPV